MLWVGVAGSPGEYLIFIWHLWHRDWNPANVIITLKIKLNINQYCRDQRYICPHCSSINPAGFLPNVPQALCISQLWIEAFLAEFFTARLFTVATLIYFQLQCQQPSWKGKKKSFSSLSFVRQKAVATQIFCLLTALIKFRKLLWHKLPRASVRVSAYPKEPTSGFSIHVPPWNHLFWKRKKKKPSKKHFKGFNNLISTAFIWCEFAELGSRGAVSVQWVLLSKFPRGENVQSPLFRNIWSSAVWPDFTLALEVKALFRGYFIYGANELFFSLNN